MSKRHTLVNAFFLSQFSYFPLVKMCYIALEIIRLIFPMKNSSYTVTNNLYFMNYWKGVLLGLFII